MPIDDPYYDTNGKCGFVFSSDPTDNVYDEVTGTYGPRQLESTFALRCDSCRDQLSLDDLGNWVAAGTNSRAECAKCRQEGEQIRRNALDDLDDIDKMLAEMEDEDH